MKNSGYLLSIRLVFVFVCASWLPSCVKDHSTRTYTIFTPIYKTKAAAYADVNTSAPRSVSKAGKIYLRGKYIFLNEVDKGVHIIDNENPSSPVNVGFIPIPGNIDIAVKGNTLYADMYSDLLAIDISDPTRAELKNVVKNSFPYRMYAGGFTGDTTRIIVDWHKKDTTVQENGNNIAYVNLERSLLAFASTDASPKAYNPFGTGGSMARFTIAGNMLYTVGTSDLSAFSIASPEDPVFTNKINLSWGIETIFPFRDKLFIGSTTGMFIFDISNPSAPSQLGRFEHARRCDPVVADDDYAYVTLRGGTNCGGLDLNQLDVIDISNLSSPQLLKSYPLTNPHGLSKDGNMMFICDGADGLKVFDATDVLKLKLINHIKGFETYDVIAMNNRAIVVEKRGIRQYDYSNPSNIKLLSTISWAN